MNKNTSSIFMIGGTVLLFTALVFLILKELNLIEVTFLEIIESPFKP